MKRLHGWIKYVLGLGVLAGIMAGCAGVGENQTYDAPNSRAEIVRVRGCEYVHVPGITMDAGDAMCHAGDCDNPIHKADTIR